MTILQKIREEIERRMKVHMVSNHGFSARYDELKDLLSFLDTMQEEEVDLEKEMDNWRHNHFHGRRDYSAAGEYLERTSQLEIARYFYNLGKQSSDKDCPKIIGKT